MKKNIFIVTCLLALSGLMSIASAQTKSLPPSDKEIPFDKEPRVIKQVNTEYPSSMLSGGWEATVYMKAFIDVEGNVTDAKSEKIQVTAARTDDQHDAAGTKQADGKAFEEAAYAAVKQWKFSPAQMQGKPVAVWVTIPFRFKLSGKGPSPVNEADREKMEKAMESIKTTIENILKGTDLENAKKKVSKDAMLIANTKTENLYSVLNGEHKELRLNEGKEAKRTNINVKVYDKGKSALIVWTSELPGKKNKRIHSIMLSLTAENTWQITHWHVSW
ncbi:MAG: energy transducer TonB [Ignavibacteriae bacterium]|nr:MAG: energy transducer TonB [Ignavibacteriota bacterium]